MGAIESVGTHLARLLPGADAGTLRRLEVGARQQTFGSRDVLHARGIPLPPFVVLDGHVMDRRVAETGQVYGALIAGPGYLGGLRAISDRDGDAFYELVALTDGTWATWDPGFVRGLALEDGGLAVGLLDLARRWATRRGPRTMCMGRPPSRSISRRPTRRSAAIARLRQVANESGNGTDGVPWRPRASASAPRRSGGSEG